MDDNTSPPAAPSIPISTIQASILEKFPRLRDELAKYPLDRVKCPKAFTYGTAGFRTLAETLEAPLHRMGMLAVLRSRLLHQIVGVMITASHNLECDNGLKLVDGTGEMLAESWEHYCELLANAESTEDVLRALATIVAQEKIDLGASGNIFVARDTRSSSEPLAEVVREGALALGGNVLDFGLQSTPQLHHYVRLWNFGKYNLGDWASESGYYAMLSDGYQRLLTSGSLDSSLDHHHHHHHHHHHGQEDDDLYIDAAHGVGAIQVEKLAKIICYSATSSSSSSNNNNKTTSSSGSSIESDAVQQQQPPPPATTEQKTKTTYQWHIRNTPPEGQLNVDCGAEFCQKARRPPSGFSPSGDTQRRCCSLDGDADRLVYHYFDDGGQWHLLDGDKIAAFIATFFREHLLTLKGLLEPSSSSGDFSHLRFGVVQTAYANGASTKYIRALGIVPAVAKTGVKFCHHVAKHEFDIGLYMEANGHGTVLFQDKAVEQLQKIESSCTSSSLDDVAKKKACVELLAAYQIINQSVGDAMSLMLMIEALLRCRGWSIHQWDAIYADFPR